MLDSALCRSQQDVALMHLSGHDTCNFLLLMEMFCEMLNRHKHWNLQLLQKSHVVIHLLHCHLSHYRTVLFVVLTMFLLVHKLQCC